MSSKLACSKTIIISTTLSYTLCIIIGSLIKLQNVIPDTVQYSDKTLHLVGYSGLCFFWCTYYLYVHNQKKYIWKPIVVSSFIGIFMEVLQYSCTSYRSLDVLDIVANTIGVFLGAGFYLLILKIWVTLKKRSA